MNARTCLEYFQQKVARGDTSEFHIVDHTKALKERIANDGPQPKTRFQIELDDPEEYSKWNANKDRIIKRAKNKSVAITLMNMAWDLMTDAMIDRFLAEQDGPPR